MVPELERHELEAGGLDFQRTMDCINRGDKLRQRTNNAFMLALVLIVAAVLYFVFSDPNSVGRRNGAIAAVIGSVVAVVAYLRAKIHDGYVNGIRAIIASTPRAKQAAVEAAEEALKAARRNAAE